MERRELPQSIAFVVQTDLRSAIFNRDLTKSIEKSGEPCRIRTCDPLIKSQLLYQLS